MSKADLRRQTKHAAAFKANVDQAITAMLTQPATRDFLWWLLTIGKVGQQPFAGIDSHTNFQCGELNVGNQILARILEVDPEGYVLLVKEKQREHRTDLAVRSPDGADYHAQSAGTYGDDPSDDGPGFDAALDA